MWDHYIGFGISGILTNLPCSTLSLVLVKVFQFSKLKIKHLHKMVGEGGGEIDFLGGNRTCITYVCKKEKKKSFLVGSNHKNVKLHCKKSSALLTTILGHIQQR